MKLLRLSGKILLACMLPLLASCAHIAGSPFAGHPLIGKVWDAADGHFVEPAALMERAVEARFVLLGEIHDNIEHHRIQARVLQTLVEAGRRPALVMEQYDVEQQAAINSVVQGSASDADKLKALGEMMRKGWDWPIYEPVVRIALQHRLPLIAANLSRNTLRQVSRQGFGSLGEGEPERLAIDTIWTPQRQQQLLRELAAGHCNKMPQHMGDAIAKAQRARDAVLADMLVRTARNGAVALLGRGHARQDMGVPVYLAARVPDAPVLSIGLVEVEAQANPAAYAYGPLGQRHNYLWFTPRAERKVDPCDSVPAPTKTAAAS